MTNEMKLLVAMCDAMGLEVETELDYGERKLTRLEADHYFKPGSFGFSASRTLKTNNRGGDQAAYLIDDDGMYTEILLNPTVNYKVTKKDSK